MANPAEGYESFMVPTLFGPWAARLVDAAGARRGDRVLDVGCGTGVVARQVAARLGPGAAVTGLDSSRDMLAVARAAAVRDAAAIGWLEGRAEQLPFAASTFDLVLCQFALMFFDDRTAALSEMRRVARGGGRVVASVWQGLERHPFYSALHHVIERRLGASAVQDIFSLGNADDLRRLAVDAGFTAVAIEPASMAARFPNPEGFLAGEIEVDTASIPSMQRLDAPARRAIVEAIADDMRSPLAEVTQGQHVVLEFHVHVLEARP
jgi:SAM-dependent methyltransferase